MAIYQLVVKGNSNDGNALRNVHYYNVSGTTLSVAQQQELVDGVDSAYKAFLQAILADTVAISAYDVRQVDLPDLPAIEYIPTAGAWGGTENSDQLALQLCALTTFKAPTVYPRTSRTYHFPMTEFSNTGDGRLDPSAQTDCNLWAAGMQSIPVTGGLNPEKCTVKFGGDPRVVTDFNILQSFITARNFATQRRRKRGVGI